MTKEEKAALVRLVKYMQSLQREISEPNTNDATEEEVRTLLQLLWKWTPTANQPLPKKSVIEQLVGLMRGCEPREYAYISRQAVARIIRKLSKERLTNNDMSVVLNKDSDDMTDTQLYDNGCWNYKETPLVNLFWDIHCNPQFLEQ